MSLLVLVFDRKVVYLLLNEYVHKGGKIIIVTMIAKELRQKEGR